MLFFEQRDLLLFAKTGFGKSHIFQLLPFMTPVADLVLILIPLKLLQAKQSTIINRIANAKSIVLNGKNNLVSVHKKIVKDGYTYVLTSLEIALSKKFKKNVLNQSNFTSRFCLLTIDETHLVDQ